MRDLLEKTNAEGQVKASEKHLLARGIVTLTVVILCLTAMTITAFAYYSFDIVSGSNKIKAAVFDADIVIRSTDLAEYVSVVPGASRTYSARLKGNVEYQITLQHKQLSTASTGFITVKIDGLQNVFYTQQLTKGKNAAVTFKLTCGEDAYITFTACWGTSIYGTQDEVYISDGRVLNFGQNTIPGGVSEDGQEGEGMVPENTEPETIEPEATEPDIAEPSDTEPEVTEPKVEEPDVSEGIESDNAQAGNDIAVAGGAQVNTNETFKGEGTYES